MAFSKEKLKNSLKKDIGKKYSVSIVTATYNRKLILKEVINSFLNQSFTGNLEIIVVDDGSSDGTKEMMKKAFSKNKKVKFFSKNHMGPLFVKNFGISKASNDLVIIMDDDCVASKTWLEELIEPLINSNNYFGVSSFSPHGGTSSVFYKKDLVKIKGFDLDFNKFHHRDDTDLIFRLENLTKKSFLFLENKAKFEHKHKQPVGRKAKLKYGWNRIGFHVNDTLLFKKHPEKAKAMLDIKFGFIRNPIKDFQVATGLWAGKDNFSFSSPQGVRIIENKTFFHTLIIIFLGIIYVFLVAFARLYGSFLFKKFLI